MYSFAKSRNEAAAGEKICSFFHASAVVVSSAGEKGMKRGPS